MKQIRKISNIIAEELEASLSEMGIELEDEAFESRVSEIVEMISEQVDEGGCKSKKKSCIKEVAGVLDEEVEVADIYMATKDTTLGGVEIGEGEFIQIDDIDMDNDEISFIVYDTEGEVKVESAVAPYDDVEMFTSEAEIVDIDDEEDEEDMDEAFGKQRTMALKKKGFSAKDIKLKAKLAAKKVAGKVNKFTIKNGKIVKKSAEELANDKKKSKTFGKRMKRFAKKRVKSFNKNFKKFGAKEGFDITLGDMTFAIEEGDIISYNNGTISVVREGNTIVSGISVSEDFINRCISEGVVEEGKCSKEDSDEGCSKKGDKENVDEAVLLTFNSSKGFVMVKEGAEVPMGNRIRARAILRNEGFNVTSEMLDSASEGKVVTL